jgi:hypothetical protein
LPGVVVQRPAISKWLTPKPILAMSFGTLPRLERFARIALGAIIDLPWRAILAQTLGIDKAFDKAYEDSSAILSSRRQYCAAGKIQCGPNEGHPA